MGYANLVVSGRGSWAFHLCWALTQGHRSGSNIKNPGVHQGCLPGPLPTNYFPSSGHGPHLTNNPRKDQAKGSLIHKDNLVPPLGSGILLLAYCCFLQQGLPLYPYSGALRMGPSILSAISPPLCPALPSYPVFSLPTELSDFFSAPHPAGADSAVC